jgi:hypothetical protein
MFRASRPPIKGCALLCKLSQHDTTGEWAAEDGGTPLEVRSAAGGGLEIWHHPDSGDGVGEAVALDKMKGAAQ